MDEKVDAERIKAAVRDRYGDIARRFAEQAQSPVRASCCGSSPARQESSSCCGPSHAEAIETAAARFYGRDELTGLPGSVTEASLGCGNPLAIASLRPGEVVLDLGSGGGIDCFLAARQVGPEGRVIGLDMTPDMIKLARQNAKKLEVTNVDFRFGEMEDMPLRDESVDVVISNCVINLSPDKDAVFAEAYRVLRPGGRLSVSDIVVDGDLPEFIRRRLDAWAECISGALDEKVYLAKIQAAGFERVEVLSRERSEVDEAAAWDDGDLAVSAGDGADAGFTPAALASRVASIKVTAYKPA